MHGINEAVLLAQKINDKSRNREVVYMEQVGIFVAEYAEWFYRGSSVVILILLIYVLHRIKKVERKSFLMNEEIEKKLQKIENDRCVKQTEKQAEKQIESRAQNTLEKEKQESDQDAESVTVIRDVIEEVFS